MDDAEDVPERGTWSRKKKDLAPRGVFRQPSGDWGIRFTCGAGHKHKQRVGPLKSEALRCYHERRNRAASSPGWCPSVDSRRAREQAKEAKKREQARLGFEDY